MSKVNRKSSQERLLKKAFSDDYLRKLARSVGIKRVSRQCLSIAREDGFSFLSTIIRDCALRAECANRTTIRGEDVQLSLASHQEQ